MDGTGDADFLQVAIGSGMIVGPADRGCLEIVTPPMRLVGIGISRLKVLRCPERPKSCQAGAEVLVIAGEQDCASSSAELCHVLDVAGGQCARFICANSASLVICRVSKLQQV